MTLAIYSIDGFTAPPPRPFSDRPEWTDARVEQLKQLAGEKLSASEIAAELACGFSRNAVIGKLSRLHVPLSNADKLGVSKLARANQPATRRPRQRATKFSFAGAVTFAPAHIMAPSEHGSAPANTGPTLASRMVPLLDLRDGECKYPIDVDGKRLFCAAPQWNPQSGTDNYCIVHSDTCFRPVSR